MAPPVTPWRKLEGADEVVAVANEARIQTPTNHLIVIDDRWMMDSER
jgi:hypothetical protein